MTRLSRLLPLLVAAVLVALGTAACGEQKIQIPHSDPSYNVDYSAATIFRQRCAGCHSLSYAASDGSGNNPRTYLTISGPNFNLRCERPVLRVLYAIENGGFSGAYMPAGIVVGQQARDIAYFVAKFSGRQAPVQAGTTKCQDQPIGQLPTSPTGGLSQPNQATVTSTVPGKVSPGNPSTAGASANPTKNG